MGLLDNDRRRHRNRPRRVFDSLDLALKSTPDEDHLRDVREGVRLVYSQFVKVLAGSGAELLKTEGKEFDPAIAEAVQIVETDNPDEDGVVVEEVRRGFMYQDELMRPAMVRVARYVAPLVEEEAAEMAAAGEDGGNDAGSEREEDSEDVELDFSEDEDEPTPDE